MGRRLEAVRGATTLQRETRNLGPHLPPSTTPSRVAFEVTAPKVVENEGEVVMQDNNFPARRHRPRRRHHRRRHRRRVSSSSGNSEERELQPMEGRDTGVNAVPSTLSSLPNLRTTAACCDSGLQGLGNAADPPAAAGSCACCRPTGRRQEVFKGEHRKGSKASCGYFFASSHDHNPSTLARQRPGEADKCSLTKESKNDPEATCSPRSRSHDSSTRSPSMKGERSDKRTSATPASHISHTSGPRERCGHSSRPLVLLSHSTTPTPPHTDATGSPPGPGHVLSARQADHASPPATKRHITVESPGRTMNDTLLLEDCGHHAASSGETRSPAESPSMPTHTQSSSSCGSPPFITARPRHAQPGGASPPSVRNQPCRGQAATPLRASWWPLLLTPPLLLLLLLPPAASPTELDKEGEAAGHEW